MLIAGSNGNTRNLEVLEVACVFRGMEAMFFSKSQYALQYKTCDTDCDSYFQLMLTRQKLRLLSAEY